MDELSINKEDFLNELSTLISEGKTLLKRKVSTISDLQVFESDYKKWDDKNIKLLSNSFVESDGQTLKNYQKSTIFVGFSSKSDRKSILKNASLARLENLLEKINAKNNYLLNIEALFGKSVLSVNAVDKKGAKEINIAYNNQKVFIVHGHDEGPKESVARTLSLLGLDPIILHEKANEGQSIIEKLERHSDVGFAVVILTDDDLGKSKKDKEYKPRARQNVILELGFFINGLGRNRVVPIYALGLEIPSDFDGVIYIPYDSASSWKVSLVKELKAAGFEVDANRLF